MESDIVNNALRFAALGIPVFPLIPDTKDPAIAEYPVVASCDPVKVRSFFHDPVMGWEVAANVGLLMRGFLGVDIDAKDGQRGLESLEMFDLMGLEFPPTLTQRTPTGGIHYVYSLPKNVTVRNSAGTLAPGIDVRGRGGYLVGGGSTVPKGSYRTDWASIVPAPGWLLDRLARTAARTDKAPQTSPKIEVNTSQAIKCGLSYVLGTPGASQGSRDSRAYAMACHLKNLGVPELDAYDLLNDNWAPRCHPPLAADELLTPVENAYRYARDQDPILAPEFEFDELPMQPPAPEPKKEAPKVDTVLELNDNYAFVITDTSHHIIFETTDAKGYPKVKHYSEDSFHAKLASRSKVVGDKPVAITRLWMRHPFRRSYEGFVFDPSKTSDTRYYNLWHGFAFEPVTDFSTVTDVAREGLELFLEHSLKNICLGDQELHEWLIGYFAHMFQKPWEKPGVAIVFRGKKGVGKNALLKHVGKLLGSHFMLTSHKRYLIGNFNSHLENKIGIVLDEAFWSGEKDIEGVLKDLVTGDTHTIERKNKEPYVVDSCLRTFILGNEQWLVPATEDERRYAVFEVGEGRIRDEIFFERMRLGMEAGGYSLLLRYFLDYDLSKIRVRVAPDTVGLYEQKKHSLNPFERWWYDCLYEATIKGSTLLDGWPTTVSRNELRDAYGAYKEKNRIKGWGLVAEEFGRLWKQVTPPLKSHQQRNETGGRVRLYEMPPLEDCRIFFEKRMKHQITWED